MKSHGFWRSRRQGRRTILNLISLTLAMAMCGAMLAPSDAHAAKRSSSQDEVDEEYSFDWLDPDKKIYVLQNRRYRKAGRPQLTGMAGFGLSGAYTDNYSAEGRVGFYFTEWLGIEAFYAKYFNSQNSTFQALIDSGTSVLPNLREVRSAYGGLLHYSPWYAKINVFNAILYFDWYFSGGVGKIGTFVDTRTNVSDPQNFVQQDKTAFFLGTGHQYHLSETFVFRIDITGAFYKAKVREAGPNEAWYSNFNLMAGAGVRF